MSAINISRIAGLHRLLVSEGWIEDFRLKGTQGLILFTHPDHDRRQLNLPVDHLRYIDWYECCERAAAKLGEMTGRDLATIWAAADKRSRPGRLRRAARDVAVSAAVAAAVTYSGGLAWNHMTAPPPVSIALAGCMDSEGAKAVSRMAYDIQVDLSGDADAMKTFAWVRWRALQAVANAEEMRKCYLEAQAYSRRFDEDGLIGEDMRRIEDGVKVVYADIGASLAGAGGTEQNRTKAKAAYLVAEAAGQRMSIRLGNIVAKWHL
ncbi:hypothetical protein GOB57_09690 [Sinorhizobium meliloti]|nr:hypothetical protein [Sinorhizobium meliloti]